MKHVVMAKCAYGSRVAALNLFIGISTDYGEALSQSGSMLQMQVDSNGAYIVDCNLAFETEELASPLCSLIKQEAPDMIPGGNTLSTHDCYHAEGLPCKAEITEEW